MTYYYVIVFFVIYIFTHFFLHLLLGQKNQVRDRISGRINKKNAEVASAVENRSANKFFGLIVKSGNYFQNILKGDWLDRSRLNLFHAGFREDHHLSIYIVIRILGSLSIIGTSVLLYWIDIFLIENHIYQFILFFIAGCIFFVGTEIILDKFSAARRLRIELGLPDCLDLLVVCTEAGLGLDAALKKVSGELGNQHRDLALELDVAVLELNFLPERRQALENFAERTQCGGISRLVNTLIQSEKFGTPLAQALRVISDELRSERLMRAEEKAARLPAVLTVPMIVFILPTLFIVLAGPAFIHGQWNQELLTTARELDTTSNEV